MSAAPYMKFGLHLIVAGILLFIVNNMWNIFKAIFSDYLSAPGADFVLMIFNGLVLIVVIIELIGLIANVLKERAYR